MTVKLPALPAVMGEGKPETIILLAAAGVTVMPVSLPVMPPSVAVSDCVPAVFSAALKVCTPASEARNV